MTSFTLIVRDVAIGGALAYIDPLLSAQGMLAVPKALRYGPRLTWRSASWLRRFS